LYFSAVAGVDLGPVQQGDAQLERVSGTLFRLRPTPAFGGVAPGQTVRWVFTHPEVMIMADKAPQAPYLVFDAQPDVGRPVSQYRLEPLAGPAQRRLAPDDTEPLVTVEALFARYQSARDLPLTDLPLVFPTPVSVKPQGGTLHWERLPLIQAAASLGAEKRLAQRILSRYFAAATASAAKASRLTLQILPVAAQSSAEAYELRVEDSGVTITGNTAQAVSRGLQSLRDLLPLTGAPAAGVHLPKLTLVDAPRFEYRGVQLDVARNFQSKATVMRLLDLMARYKLNKFHFHLIDDEGWRVQIAGLPELTAFGARRGHPADLTRHLPSAYGSGPDVNDLHGSGFYTADDYMAIVRHAAALHIEVIPEFEMPGHARAAVKAMEYRSRQLLAQGQSKAMAHRYLLSDPQDASVYQSPQLYTDHVVNPGMESSYTFIEHVVKQFARMHRQAGVPLRHLHVGGDELPKGAWEKSPAARATMRQLGLPDTAALWDHFYNRVDTILRRAGVLASGWEELGARTAKLRGQRRVIANPEFLRRGFTVYVWNNLDDDQDLAYRLANAGYQTVLAPVTHLYFDMAHVKSDTEQGHNWGAYTDLDQVFDFVPFDFVRKSATDATPVAGKEGLTDFGQSHILGLEATLFTETMREPSRIDYMLMPRMLGLAQRAWVADPAWAQERDPAKAKTLHAADWSVFANTVGKRVLPRLDAEQSGLAYRIAPPGLRLVDGQVLANHMLPGTTLRYTTDGSLPNANSPAVQGPILAKGTILVAAFDRNGRSGRASRIEVP
jgi:hexosaminidase